MSGNIDDTLNRIEGAITAEGSEVAAAVQALKDEIAGLQTGTRITDEQKARLDGFADRIGQIFAAAPPPVESSAEG